MNDPQRQHRNILHKGRGTGTVSPEMIEERAREIARIKDRPGHHPMDEDRQQARTELEGQPPPLDSFSGPHPYPEEVDTSGETTGLRGHRKPKKQASDENEIMRGNVEDGVDEADHEQRVEGNRREDRIERPDPNLS